VGNPDRVIKTIMAAAQLDKTVEAAVAASGRAGGDEQSTIGQIRELLFGETQRRNDDQAQQLKHLIDALEARLTERLDKLDARVKALAEAADDDRRQNLSDLGKELGALAAQITKLGDKPGRARSG
jgi:DNA-binding transcriptional MerR regulator